MSREIESTQERHELVVTLSVAALISNPNSTGLVLVQDKNTGKWQPPAGGLIRKEDRMETFEEAVLREVFEETGIRPVRTPRLLTVINIPGKNKNHIGAIFQTSFGYDELSHLHPQDTSEIEAVRVFTDKELFELLNTPDAINRPQFNKGLIAWWWRNEHRDVWDPHRGTEPEDKGISLDEIYLKKWA